jgi:hypothetical protein
MAVPSSKSVLSTLIVKYMRNLGAQLQFLCILFVATALLRVVSETLCERFAFQKAISNGKEHHLLRCQTASSNKYEQLLARAPLSTVTPYRRP